MYHIFHSPTNVVPTEPLGNNSLHKQIFTRHSGPLQTPHPASVFTSLSPLPSIQSNPSATPHTTPAAPSLFQRFSPSAAATMLRHPVLLLALAVVLLTACTVALPVVQAPMYRGYRAGGVNGMLTTRFNANGLFTPRIFPAPMTPLGATGRVASPLAMNAMAGMGVREYASCTTSPLAINCSYTVDDSASVYDCSSGSAISTAAFREVARFSKDGGALCSDFVMDITNTALDGGAALACDARPPCRGARACEKRTRFIAWGRDAPRATEDYYMWEVYASYEPSCYQYEEHPGPQAQYWPALLNNNDAFQEMKDTFDALPFSAVNGNPNLYPSLCVFIKNVMCQ